MYTILKGMKREEMGDQNIPIYYRKACCLIEAEQQVYLFILKSCQISSFLILIIVNSCLSETGKM